MSTDTITLAAQKRDILGKQVRALRAGGQLPAVIHHHGKESIHITVDEKDLRKVYSVAGRHHPVDLTVDGKKFTTLIKEVTQKPASAKIYHSVFQAIKANELVKAEIPLKFVGEEIPAEKANLMVLHNLEIVDVEALPRDLVDVIEVDATVLAEVGDKITVADLKVPSAMTIKTDPEQVIASVEMPKDQIAEADAAAEELAADAAESGDAEAGGEEASEGDAGDSADKAEGDAPAKNKAEDKKED